MIADAGLVLGVALISTGAGLVSIPAGLIVAGSLVLAAVILSVRNSSSAPTPTEMTSDDR